MREYQHGRQVIEFQVQLIGFKQINGAPVQRNSETKIQQSQIYNKKSNIAFKFQIDDLVWARQFKPDDGLCKKFSPKLKGPYTVVQCLH